MILILILVLVTFNFYQQPHVTKLDYGAMGMGVMMAILLSRMFFADWSDFWQGFWSSGTRRWFGAQDVEKGWRGLMFTVWSLLSFACGVSAYMELPAWFPRVFK